MIHDDSTDLGLRGLELLDYTLKFIEAEPESWDQHMWISARGVPEDIMHALHFGDVEVEIPHSCKTTACVAGWAARFAGGQPLWRAAYDEDQVDAGTVDTNVGEQPICTYAAEAMGLTRMEADMLFAAAATLNDLKFWRDQIAERMERDEARQYRAPEPKGERK